jgi:hypothetical protein
MTRTVLVRRCAFGAAILLAGCLLLTACGGTGSTSSPSTASAPGALSHAEHQNAAAGSAFSGAVAAPAGRIAAGSSSASSGSAGNSSAALTAGLTPADQSIVYTASIELRAANVGVVARRITSLVESAGGYISAETAGSARSRTGQTIDITLKIPVPAYAAVLAQLSSPALGTQLSMHQQATDVTQEVANVSSLVTSEQAAITALDGLLQRAASVSDLLQVQQQISADESTLNSLQAQQRALNDETSYATVSMTLVPPPHVVPPKQPAGRSFLTGLRSGWRALRHSADWLATALGTVLPFVAILVVLAALGYAGRRRYVRRRIGPPAAE